MTDLKNITAIVKVLLENDKSCRNSDSFLYLKVLYVVAHQKGINLENVSVPYFLLCLQGTTFPPFESVRRARQKIQAKHPEFAACKAVEGFRAENEVNFREYARGDV